MVGSGSGIKKIPDPQHYRRQEVGITKHKRTTGRYLSGLRSQALITTRVTKYIRGLSYLDSEEPEARSLDHQKIVLRKPYCSATKKSGGSYV
jgi:hypothetical protein